MNRSFSCSVAVIALLLAGCTGGDDGDTAAEYQPATLSSADPDGIKTVTFTEDAARRVQLATSPVVPAADGVSVEYAALIYDKAGATWVYTAPEALTYRRTKVTVAEVAGDRVTLSSGPPAGVLVVTVGATEVYGAELDIAGKH